MLLGMGKRTRAPRQRRRADLVFTSPLNTPTDGIVRTTAATEEAAKRFGIGSPAACAAWAEERAARLRGLALTLGCTVEEVPGVIAGFAARER